MIDPTTPGFTSLVPPDLNLHPTFPAEPAFRPACVDRDVHFRHSGWLRDRRRVWDALRDVFPDSTRIRRFQDCGSGAWVVRNEEDPTNYAVVSDHCRDRFCRPCASFRGRVIAHNVSAYLRDRPYRFVTITIKTTGLSLRDGVNKLYRCFGLLRRSKLWTQKVTGGCAICEVLPREGGTEWHPHLHLIVEGKYIPVKPLRKLWHAITGDSYIIDISRGTDAERAAQYVSKYITKPFDDGTTRNPVRLIEAIKALHGRRLIATFGTWRGQRLTEYHPLGTWIKVCTLGELRERIRKGDADGELLYAFLATHRTYRNLPKPDTPPVYRDPNGNKGKAAPDDSLRESDQVPTGSHHPPLLSPPPMPPPTETAPAGSNPPPASGRDAPPTPLGPRRLTGVPAV